MLKVTSYGSELWLLRWTLELCPYPETLCEEGRTRCCSRQVRAEVEGDRLDYCGWTAHQD